MGVGGESKHAGGRAGLGCDAETLQWAISEGWEQSFHQGGVSAEGKDRDSSPAARAGACSEKSSETAVELPRDVTCRGPARETPHCRGRMAVCLSVSD